MTRGNSIGSSHARSACSSSTWPGCGSLLFYLLCGYYASLVGYAFGSVPKACTYHFYTILSPVSCHLWQNVLGSDVGTSSILDPLATLHKIDRCMLVLGTERSVEKKYPHAFFIAFDCMQNILELQQMLELFGFGGKGEGVYQYRGTGATRRFASVSLTRYFHRRT